MKKNKVLLLTLSLLTSLLISVNHTNIIPLDNNEYILYPETKESFAVVNSKDYIIKISKDGDNDILYRNPDMVTDKNTFRNTLLRIEFVGNLRSVTIANTQNHFNLYDLEFISPSIAEVSVPEGIYGIFTVFFDQAEDVFKFVAKSDIDLTSGGTEEVVINESEAEFHLIHDSFDVNNEPFEINERFESYFGFGFYDHNCYFSFHSLDQGMYSSDIINMSTLVTGEHSYDENSIYSTQHGPFTEINNDMLFSNVPADYEHQQISLDIPEYIWESKINVSPGYWFPDLYSTIIYPWNCIDVDEGTYTMDLYMMNNDYTNSGTTTRFFLGNIINEQFQFYYNSAPFHCIDDKIGSFLNTTPIETDYLSPDHETLTLGESPKYIYTYFYYYFNSLYCSVNFKRFEEECVFNDYSDSSFLIMDSTETVISEGELIELDISDLLPDEYTLIIENSNFLYSGLESRAKLINTFNLDPTLSSPPRLHAFQIRNEDNIPTTKLEFNENGNLLFLLTDTEVINNEYIYFPVIDDSVKVFYKEHQNLIWNEVDVEMINEYEEPTWTFGKVFSADLSELTLIDSAAYDLKICSTDIDGNYLEFISEPSFFVGDFNASSSQDNYINNSVQYNSSVFPNPFNPSTKISFSLNYIAIKAEVQIYNIKGQKVDTLPVTMSGFEGSVTWNAEKFASGVYFYKLVADGKTMDSRKMLLLK